MFWAPQLQVWRINEWRPLSRVNRTVSPSAWQVSGTTASYTSLLPSLRQHWPAIKLLKLLCWRKSQHGGLWWSGSKAEHHPRLPAVLPSPALPPGQAVFLSLPLPGMLPGIGHASSLAPPRGPWQGMPRCIKPWKHNWSPSGGHISACEHADVCGGGTAKEKGRYSHKQPTE